MTYNATDAPDLANVTSLSGMFRSSSFSGDISNWDVSNVQAFQYMFAFSPFNGDISNWNVSGATSMKDMFQDADGFMQNLGKWFIAQSELTVFDEAASGSEVGTITPQATLPDDQVHTYTTSGGADSGKFSITPDGVLTINEPPAHATKSSYDIEIKATGNLGKTLTNTRTVTIHVVPPVTVTITSSSGATGTTGTSVSSNRLSYTATFSKPVTGFDITDITVSGTANGGNPNPSNFEAVPGGTTYTFDITADSEGTVSVRVGGDVATGDSGNGNSPSNIHELTSDTTPPVITLLGDPEVSIELGTAYIDEGATATDNIDGILTGQITTVNPVDTGVEDIYIVTYNVSDAAGNRAGPVSRTVTVTPDITPPVITLLGDNPQIIEVGTSYIELGAAATDNIDGDLTNNITTVNPVDTDVADIYTVTYDVSDAAGNRAEVSRMVTVAPDITPPDITLLGDPVVSIELGTAYTDEGATATDNIDGDLTNDITTVNPVDTDVADIYTVTYNVSDAAGNEAGQVSRTVTVTPDITPPVITLLGEPAVSIELGTPYTDEGATATDNIDGILTDQITTVNPVDMNTVGDYTVTYNVSDAAGNEAGQVSRMVTILTPLSIEGIEGTGIYISPNPTSGMIYIGNIIENIDYVLIDAKGQILKNGTLTTGNDNSVNISHLVDGVYFLNIKTSKGNFTGRVVRKAKL